MYDNQKHKQHEKTKPNIHLDNKGKVKTMTKHSETRKMQQRSKQTNSTNTAKSESIKANPHGVLYSAGGAEVYPCLNGDGIFHTLVAYR
jgi:hypothetical protein